MGFASFLSGLVIGRDAAGQVQNYWVAGVIGVGASLASIALARRLVIHSAAPAGRA
jgi:hypothetical protein